ncbi:MAG: hypothetical protein H6735_17925 [Alphaproteobacteria bacterium]|nr:hypothetical protein [Alphaproteobacteria bacterium]
MSTGFRSEEDRDGVRVSSRSEDRRSWDELELELRALQRAEEPIGSIPVYVPRHVPQRLPAGVMLGATATWLGSVFALCYVALPAAMAITGVNATVLMSAPRALISFGMGAFVVAVAAAIARPAIRLGFGGPRDPVVSATLGGLGVWAVIHNTSALLEPFWAMSPMELLTFVAANIVEMTLLGMMFASFTRSRAVAMALGGGFQLLTMGLFLTLLTLI